MSRLKRSVTVGLTGSLGSGKSTVLKMFRTKGAFTQDADEIVRRLLTQPAIVKRIRARFRHVDLGTQKFNLDKKKLAACVFGSAAMRKRLEDILHPLVRHTMKTELRRRHRRVAICDVPLLYEKGWQTDFDKIIVVESNWPIRLRRLNKRGMTAADARRRLRAQWPLVRKIRRADFVIHNSGSIQKTKAQVNQIWDTFIGGHNGITI